MPLVCFVDDFCKEKDCLIYPTKVKVNSLGNSPDLLNRKLIVESYCVRKCLYTRQDFMEWLQAKDPSYLARKLFETEEPVKSPLS